MEEVDNIIIDSLKHLNCNFEENVSSIKDFNPDMVVDAIVSCLEAITPGVSLSHKLPPSMSLRLKLASNLAERIKDLGFRGDMGYQTILYCNEVEVRRVLMFLIERIPRESEVVLNQEIGYVPKLIKEIEGKVKLSLEKPWVSSVFLKHGARACGNTYIKQGYDSTYPLQTEHLQVPNTQFEADEDLKQYWIHHVPDVTAQCSRQNLIPSLLFKDTEYTMSNINLTSCHYNDMDLSKNELHETSDVSSAELTANGIEKLSETKSNTANSVSTTNDRIQTLMEDIQERKECTVQLKQEMKAAEAKLTQLIEIKTKEVETLKDMAAKYKIKSRTLTVLSKEENLAKLKSLVENGNERLTELANQWKDVQTPLLQQYESLKHSLSSQEIKLQEEQDKLRNMKEKNQLLTNELRDKEKLEQQLKQECERVNKHTNRSAYTRRILEIIANIKKQNEEITKILKDTKEIQKDINNLNGQLDRSFTLSDELIFRDAKHNEMSRKAYKLLASLHNEFSAITQAVTELGLTERETRNLQEQVDAEYSKETDKKLKRVNKDLQEVKKETALLLKQIQV